MRAIKLDLRDFFSEASGMSLDDSIRLTNHLATAYSRSLCVEVHVFGAELRAASPFEKRISLLPTKVSEFIDTVVNHQGISYGLPVGMYLHDKQIAIGDLHAIEKSWRQMRGGSTRARH